MVNRKRINSAQSMIFFWISPVVKQVAKFNHVLGRGFVLQRVKLIFIKCCQQIRMNYFTWMYNIIITLHLTVLAYVYICIDMYALHRIRFIIRMHLYISLFQTAIIIEKLLIKTVRSITNWKCLILKTNY